MVLVCLAILLTCRSAIAFLISVHREVTENALMSFSQLQIPDAERKTIIQGSVDADLDEGNLPITRGPYDQRFHFDNEFSYEAVLMNYATVARLVNRNISKRERDPWEFGKLLHAIEDFYAHSNYIVLYRDYVAQNGSELVGSVPTFEEVMLQPKDYRHFITLLRQDLRTGRYPQPHWYSFPTNTDHGLIIGPGMNKDSVQRTLFVDARVTATRAASWYLRLYIKDKEVKRTWTVLNYTRFSAGIP
jgi:hypothetical protein